MKPPTGPQYVAKARELHEVEGEVEIDRLMTTNRQVSRSEDQDGEQGAYVRAWVWVPREAIQPEWEG